MTMFWNYTSATIEGGVHQTFNASVHMQQYENGGTQTYEKGFLVVLIIVVVVHGVILACFLALRCWYTDISEPTHLFTLGAAVSGK